MKSVIPLLLLATASCGDEAPPTPTSAETEQLDQAENMLNDIAKEEGPAPDGTGPSNQSD